MFPRLLTLALCIAATPAFAVTVQEGDYYEHLTVFDQPFLMTGGRVDDLYLVSDDAVVEGGSIGNITADFGHLNIKGGTIQGIERRDDMAGGRCEITFHGYYFQYYDRGQQEFNWYVVQGWLLDGTFADISLVNNVEQPTSLLHNYFAIEPNTGAVGDTDGDWDVDLTDLNSVRNTFGLNGPADVNDDGIVDLEDLNSVRNTFGGGMFNLDFGPPGAVIEVTESTTPVPEPPTIANTLLLLAAATAFQRGMRRAGPAVIATRKLPISV